MVDQRAAALIETDPLGAELVMIALAAWRHLPNLVSHYQGPAEWLWVSREHAAGLDELLKRARALADLAERGGDDYIAAHAQSVATQIEVQAEPTRYGYLELVERLFACSFVPPDPEEVVALGQEVLGIARQLGGSGADPVAAWESAAMVQGEAKWDAAISAYRVGRRYALDRFPVPFVEDLEIARTKTPLASLDVAWREPDHLVFEVNVDIPRTRAAIAYEVAHVVYPGDYLHIAILTQRTYAEEGRVAACIRINNAPENVIAEGIEEVAPFRLSPEHGPEEELSWKLEWLRRAASLMAAVRLRGAGESRAEVLRQLERAGHMRPDRARQEVDRIEHPLWGTYLYSYWLGRHLVQEADRLAGDAVRGVDYLRWLYGGLHLPDTFLSAARRPAPAPTW